MKNSEEEFIKLMGLRMKNLRKERKMTQLDVAVKAGMEENAYQRIESGRTNPSVKTLLRIAKAMGVEIKEFFSLV